MAKISEKSETRDLRQEFLTMLASSDRSDACRAISDRTEQLIRLTGKGFDLSGMDLSNANLRGLNLRKAVLNQTQLYGADLSEANLSEVTMICPGLERTKFMGADLSGGYMHALAAQVCDFTNANLSNIVDGTGSLFHGSKMIGVDLRNSVLGGSTFYQCHLDGADFENADLQGVTFNECYLDHTQFTNASISQLTVTKTHIKNVSLTSASGHGVVFQRLSTCDDLDLTGAHLPFVRFDQVVGNIKAHNLYGYGADFNASLLSGSDFTGADMSYSRWIACNIERISMHEAVLENVSMHACRGSDSNLTGVRAEYFRAIECSFQRSQMAGFAGRGSFFRDTDLSECDMERAYLYRATITGDPPKSMSLRKSNLQNANLVQAYVAADMTCANLRGANLVYSRVNQSSFSHTDLGGVNLYEASAVKVDFTGAKLPNVSGPFFADRCSGLVDALGAPEGKLNAFVSQLQALLKDAGGSSTHNKEERV